GAAAPEEPVERVVQVPGGAFRNDGPGHMGTADGTVPARRKDVVERHRHAEGLETFCHGAPPADAILPAALEKFVELGRIGGQEVAQHVHLAPGGAHRELAAADDPDAEPMPRLLRGSHARERVVIGQGDGGKAGPGCALHHDFGLQLAIGCGGVEVEVNGSRREGGQREYPISGAVQAGWLYWKSRRSCPSVICDSEISRTFEPTGE